MVLIKLCVAIIVLAGIAYTIQHSISELRLKHRQLGAQIEDLEKEIESTSSTAEIERLTTALRRAERQRDGFWKVDAPTLIVSVVIYTMGGFFAGLFWHRTLRSFGYPRSKRQTLSAYFLGHLGKYVPGKAMVFLLRAGWMRRYNVPVTVTIISIFVETLTLMGVGAAIGAIALLCTKPEGSLMVAAIALVFCASLPTLPPVFRRVMSFVAKRRVGALDAKVEHGLTWSLFSQGWLLMSLNWLQVALSMWILLQGMGATQDLPGINGPYTYAVCLAAVTLSVVAGIVSLIPGGAGIRELVVTVILAQDMGTAAAFAVAIVFRLVTLISEIILVTLTHTVNGWTAEKA